MRVQFFISCFIAVLSLFLAVSPGTTAPADAFRVSDFQQLQAAVRTVAGSSAGGTIILKSGRYAGTQPLVLDRTNGDKSINVFAEPGKEVVLDFSALRDIDTVSSPQSTIPGSQTPDPSPQMGITITGNGYHLKGLTVEKAGHFGIHVRGSRNIIENCVTRYNGNTGLQIGLLSGATNSGKLAGSNLILNCDSYRNFDPYSLRADTGKPAPGNDADGFGCRVNPGSGNRFEGCRAWENADDGWDFYRTDVGVEVINCWSWHEGDPRVFNGEYDREKGNPKDTNLFDLNKPHLKAEGTTVMQHMTNWGGNGNGFKLGGANSKGRHTVKNCIAFDHNYGQKGQKGFDENDNRDKIVIVDCTAFANKQNYYFVYASRAPQLFAATTNAGLLAFTNNIGFAGQLGDDIGPFSDQVIVPSADAQKQIAAAVWKAARSPRKPDGGLPDLNIRK
jgi:pectate disaccharide-lyase